MSSPSRSKGLTPSQISRAIRKSVGGSRKRCSKGKSCSATCIEGSKICEVEASPTVSSSLSKGALAIGDARPSDRPSLLEARKELRQIIIESRRKKRFDKPDKERDERYRDMIRARARAIKAEEASLFKTDRRAADKDLSILGDGELSKIAGLKRKAERAVRVQSELISILDEKIAKVSDQKSERFAKLNERRANAVRFKDMYKKEVKERGEEFNKRLAALGSVKGSATANLTATSGQARSTLKAIIGEISKLAKVLNIKGEEDAEGVNWKAAIEPGARRLGKPGQYGAFFKVPAGNLFRFGIKGDHPDGVGIKGGKIGKDEPAIVKRVGEAGLGPKLIAAKLNPNPSAGGSDVRTGLIAMGIVPGMDMFSFRSSREMVNGVEIGQAFWRSRRDIHRMGIAHNDMHPGNVLIDDKGKARFVDFGLAQSSFKAALAEAIGGVTRSDWQVNRWLVLGGDEASMQGKPPSPAYNRMNANWVTLRKAMKSDGFTDEEIRQIGSTGIRVGSESNPNANLSTGPWKNSILTDKKIAEYIDILYDGI